LCTREKEYQIAENIAEESSSPGTEQQCVAELITMTTDAMATDARVSVLVADTTVSVASDIMFCADEINSRWPIPP
jgi:hypothetical protein